MIFSISQPWLEAFSVLKETLIVSAGQRDIVTDQTVTGDHTAWEESGFLMKGKLDFNKIMPLTNHQFFPRLHGINSRPSGVPTIKMKPLLYGQSELLSDK